jgi:hypothetical protein
MFAHQRGHEGTRQELVSSIAPGSKAIQGNALLGAVAALSPTTRPLAYVFEYQIGMTDRMRKGTIDGLGAYLHQAYLEELSRYTPCFRECHRGA